MRPQNGPGNAAFSPLPVSGGSAFPCWSTSPCVLSSREVSCNTDIKTLLRPRLTFRRAQNGSPVHALLAHAEYLVYIVPVYFGVLRNSSKSPSRHSLLRRCPRATVVVPSIVSWQIVTFLSNPWVPPCLSLSDNPRSRGIQYVYLPPSFTAQDGFRPKTGSLTLTHGRLPLCGGIPPRRHCALRGFCFRRLEHRRAVGGTNLFVTQRNFGGTHYSGSCTRG